MSESGFVSEFKLEARVDQIREASAWLADLAQLRCIPDAALHRLDLCLNEALANVIEHGGEAAQAQPVHLRYRDQQSPNGATLTVSDAGHAFDPLASKPKAQPLTLADAEPGGLGIALLRECADVLAYARQHERNILSISVHW
jgi:anti-sigma regulatory factor (Ser/Thr protein kinase)